jgi:ABC-type glycerol-3-phosphate transport system permease component
MAGASLLIHPLLVFALLIRRYLVAGLTQGAVKG